MTTQRVFAYCRISVAEDTSTSIARQTETIEAVCKARGWRIVETFTDEDRSAYENGRHGTKRPALDAMMARLGEVDAVVFLRLDRLARSVVGFHRIKQQCAEAGVQLVSAEQPELDTTTPTGQAMETIVAAFAQLESDTISNRAKETAAYLRSQGKWYGQCPFGFRRDDKGRLEQDPDDFPVLVEAATRYLAGESLRSIAPSLGKHHPNLSRALRSPHTRAALPKAMGDRLTAELETRGRYGTTASPSLLGGIAVCAVCDGPMTVVATRTRNGRPWGSYACKARKHVYISQPALDRLVTAEVLRAIPTARLQKRIAKRRKTPALAPAEIELRLERLHQAHFVEDLVSREQFLKSRAELEQKLEQARASLDDSIEIPIALARELPERWPLLTVQEQRRVIKAVVARVVVSRATGTGPVDPARVEVVWR